MRIFLSTPISCFKNSDELNEYKKMVMSLVSVLKNEHIVCSEIETIRDETDYDSPEKSISTDLDSISKCDIFIFHYPKSMPTSALIELGFAIAFNKRIIIITPDKKILPYLSLGVPIFCSNSSIIESDKLNTETIDKVISII